MIQFRCECGKQLQAREEYAGQTTACPVCGKEFKIPAPEGAQRAAPPVLALAPESDEPRPVRRRRFEDDEERRPAFPTSTSGKAVTSLILGLLSFCLPLVLSIPAIILAFMGLSEIRNSRGRVGGGGFAVVGLITGILSIVTGALAALLIPAVMSVQTAAARAQSNVNLKQIGLAMHQFHDTYRQMPPAVVFSEDGKPLYSWRVLLLPFIEQNNLYAQFHLNEAWDSPHNSQFLKSMPSVYAHPSDPAAAREGRTYYQVFTAIGTDPTGWRPIFRGDKEGWRPLPFLGQQPPVFGSDSLGFPRIVDGTSNTILAAEAAEAVPWTKPDDMRYSSQLPVPRLGGLTGNTYNVLMADGSVSSIDSRHISDQLLRNAITADDAQPINWPP